MDGADHLMNQDWQNKLIPNHVRCSLNNIDNFYDVDRPLRYVERPNQSPSLSALPKKEDDIGLSGLSFCHGSLRAENLCYEHCDCCSRLDSLERSCHFLSFFLSRALAALALGCSVMG